MMIRRDFTDEERDAAIDGLEKVFDAGVTVRLPYVKNISLGTDMSPIDSPDTSSVIVHEKKTDIVFRTRTGDLTIGYVFKFKSECLLGKIEIWVESKFNDAIFVENMGACECGLIAEYFEERYARPMFEKAKDIAFMAFGYVDAKYSDVMTEMLRSVLAVGIANHDTKVDA